MSCPNLRNEILESLRSNAEGNIQKARMNIEVYLHNPVGIGEHPDVLGSIQEQLDVIAHEEERIQVINKHFTNHHD
tara:strand:+ start:352 stop:579 length:228 start_codon:yes stop_codon:yes gene_type:complete